MVGSETFVLELKGKFVKDLNVHMIYKILSIASGHEHGKKLHICSSIFLNYMIF
jgi:hypothetical protein